MRVRRKGESGEEKNMGKNGFKNETIADRKEKKREKKKKKEKRERKTKKKKEKERNEPERTNQQRKMTNRFWSFVCVWLSLCHRFFLSLSFMIFFSLSFFLFLRLGFALAGSRSK